MVSELGGPPSGSVDRSKGPVAGLRSRVLRGFFALGVAASLGLPGAAWAQPEAASVEATEADKEKARRLMDQGVEREEAKDYASALKAFEAAHALVKLPMTGYAVARAQAGLGLLMEALESATQAKLTPVRPNETPAFGKARSDAEALAQKLAARVPSIQVKVEGPSAGAEVSIDDRAIPPEAVGEPRKVNPGKHVVSAKAQGYEPASLEVDVVEGQVVPATLTLVPVTGSSPGEPGKTSGGLSPLVFVGFGVGAAGIIAGAVTGALSLSKTSSLKDQCANGICPPNKAEDISSATTLANVSNISFAVGALGAAAGVVGIFVLSGSSGDKKPVSGGVRVMPAIGPGSVGVIGVF